MSKMDFYRLKNPSWHSGNAQDESCAADQRPMSPADIDHERPGPELQTC